MKMINVIIFIAALLLNKAFSNDTSRHQDNSTVLTKYFYIYDWPEFMSDVWPPENTTLHAETPYRHDFRPNDGAGKCIATDIGYFSTWQFALYRLSIARLRTSEYRTLDPALASAFIIPFDLGVHSFIDHRNGKVRVASPHGWRAVEYLKEATKSPIFWRRNGHDHFVLFSVTSHQIIGIGAKVFLTQTCMNCSVLTIETTPTNTARKYYSGKSKKWWFAVPYPSSFHLWEGIRSPSWESPGRPLMAVFIGSLHTQTVASNQLRRRLFADCQRESHLNSSRRCAAFDTEHTDAAMLQQSDNLLLYRQSVFCLAPPGDSLTRKSLFDSLLAGCIPVVFCSATISQYAWHLPQPKLPQDTLGEVSVYIPRQSVAEDGLNFLDVLANISSTTIASMQRHIAALAPSLQYSVVPPGYGPEYDPVNVANKEKKRRGKLRQRGHNEVPQPPVKFRGNVWRPPQRDAVDVMVEHMLDPRTIEPLEGFTANEWQALQVAQQDVNLVTPSYTGYLDAASAAKAEKRPLPAAHPPPRSAVR